MSTPKIRIALAGLGFGAEFIPIYQAHPNAEIVAICQRNPEKLKAIGDRYKIAKRYTDFDALLKVAPALQILHRDILGLPMVVLHRLVEIVGRSKSVV